MPERIIDFTFIEVFTQMNKAIEQRYNERMGYSSNHIPAFFGSNELKHIQARNERMKELFKAREEGTKNNGNTIGK